MINFNKTRISKCAKGAIFTLIFAFLAFSQAFSQNTYKGNNSATARGTALGKIVSDYSNSGLTVTKADDKPTVINFPMIGIGKTASTPAFQSNGSYNVNYVITIKNFGQLDLQNIQVTDALSTAFPSPMTFSVNAANITITGGTGLTINTSYNGSTNTNLLVAASSSLAVGQTRTITVPVNIVPNGSFGLRNNTARATATTTTPDAAAVSDDSNNSTDPDGNGNGTPFDDSTPTPITLTAPDIEVVSKTVSNATPNTGSNVTFTITVRNNGGPAASVVVSDLLPAGYQYVTSTPSVGTYNPTSGDWSIGNLTNATSVTLQVVAKVLGDKLASEYRNTASTNHPADSDPTNNSKFVNVTPIPTADLAVTNTDGKTTYIPGTTNTYTFTVTNNGASNAPGSTITNTLPTGVTGTWTAVYAGGATGTASGSGSISQTVDIPSGGSVTYTYVVSIPSSYTGNFVNTGTAAVAAGITDPTPANNSATDTDAINRRADLVVTNTDGKTTYTPGTTNTYTFVVTNDGPSDAPGSTITNTLPTGATGTWTAVFAGGATGTASGTGSISQTASIPSGGSITYTYVVNVPSSHTGNFVNTATAATASGITDPTPANNSAADTDTPVRIADLAVTNTDGKTTYTPGTTNTYTFVVTNSGPSDAQGSSIVNTLPTGVTGTWTAVFAGGATGTASGTGSINQTASIPSGGSITYTYVVNVPSSYTGNFVNTGSATTATGITDPTPANNSATDTDTPVLSADLQVTNTDGKTTYTPGTTNTYTFVVTNAGPSDAPGSTVTNTLPTGLTGTWTAVFAGGATGTASGTGSISQTVGLPSGSTITYTYVVSVPSSYTGNVVNTGSVATATGITDPTPGNNSATDTDTPDRRADLVVTNTDGKTTYTPGTTNTYTFVVSNSGPSDAPGSSITNTLPTGVTGTWTAVYAGGATGTASGSGSISQTADIPSGGSITYTYVVNVPSSFTGNFVNTGSATTATGITDPTPANNTAVDTDTPNRIADLAVTNTDGKTTYTPGTTNTYTFVVTNDGPSDAPGSTITNTLPTGVTGTWTAVYAGGATGTASGSGSISQTVDIPSGGSVTYTYVVNVPSSYTGNFVNTATAATATGITDPTPANNSATDTDTPVRIADLVVTNTDGKTTYTPGTTNTYTFVVTNNGPSNAPGSSIVNTLPTGVTGTWTAVYAGGATGTASGSGSISQTVDIPSGGSVTYTYVVNVPAGFTGDFANTGTATTATGITDSNTANNTATDTDTQNSIADLAVTYTDGKTTYTPGTSNTYTFTVTNNGPSNAPGSVITNTLPTGITGGTWTAVYTGTTGPASGTGDINQTINLPSGASVTYTYVIDVPSNFTGNFVSTGSAATATGITDPTPANNSATDTDTPNRTADLVVTNTDGKTNYTPGTTNTYTFVVTNSGPSDAPGSTITNTLPTGVTGTWTAVYAGGATGTASGSGSISQTADIPSGGSITYTYVVNVPSSFTGNFVNTGSATTATGITDPTPANNTAVDTDTPNRIADLAVTNTDGKTTYTPGTTNTYTFVVTNDGPSDAPGSTITNTLPTGVTGTWTAVYAGGATGTASGSGSISQTVDIPSGGSVTYTYVVNVPSSYTGNFVNTATAATATGITDPTPANNSATDTDTQASVVDLAVTNTDGKTTYTPGTTNTYTFVVTNNGPSDATGSSIVNTLPTGVTGTWTAVYAGGATGAASGSGSIAETTNIPSGGSITYTYVVNVPAGFTGDFVNTGTATPATGITDSNTANNTATDTDTQNSIADLAVTYTDGKTTYTPGTSNTYTFTVTNNGPSNAPGSVITNTLPTGITGGTWTAVYTGTTGPASGTGDINQTIDLPSGTSVTYTYVIDVPSSFTGNFVSTGSAATATGITDPTPANNSATDTDTPNRIADLVVTNTDGKTTYTPGTTNTYTFVVTNSGPSDAPGSSITNTLPTGVTGTWTAVYAGGATGTANGTGSISQTADIPSGGSVTYTYVVSVPSSFTGNFVNTGSATTATGITDPTPANNTATDTDTPNRIADLVVTNTDGKTTYTPGTTNTYTFVVTNDGPSDAPGSTITNTLPTGVTGTWTAVYAGGATGTANGTGSINQTANIPAGGSITYTYVVSIPANFTGDFVNTGTATTATGITDPTPANNSATDTDTQASVVDLAVTNTDGKTTYTPGTTNTYTFVVTNNGPSNAPGSNITNTLPAGLTGTWTAVYTGGATGTASGNGNINQTVDIPSGGSITYTYVVNVPSNFKGDVVNTGTATPATGITDSNTANNTAVDTDTQNSIADLAVTNTDGKVTYTPGTTNTYTFVVTNGGPSDAPGSVITNTLPAGVTGTWTAVYAGGATGTANGTGSINQTVDIPSGGSITYTYVVNVPSSYTGNFVNTGTAATAAGITDPTPANNSATDTDAPNRIADLVVTNTDGKTTYTPGTTNTYTFVVTNNGPSDAPGSSIVNNLPAGVTGTWTAVYAGGATGTANGTGSISQTADIPSGGSVTYTYVVNVPSSFTGNFVNTGTAATAAGITDPTPANNSATDTDTQASITDLAVTKTASSLSPLVDGQVTFTIEAKNFGPSQANGVTVTDLLSSGYTFVSANTSKGGYTANNGVWNIGQMVPNSTETLTIVAMVNANQSNYQNQAVITGLETDPVTTNNTSTVTPVPTKIIDLAITQTISTTTPSYNGLVTMTLTARNLGPSNATGVQVADLIKAGFNLVSNTPSAGTYNATTGIWTIGNLNAGETQTLVFTARVNTTGATADYVNTAVISGTETETTLANNTATVTVVKPPMANNDSGTTIPNTPVVIDILANDVPGGAALRNQTVTITTPPLHGTVTIDPVTGKVTYTPALNYFGPDEFYYTVTDANGAVTNIAKVTIDIKDNPKIGVAKQLVSSTKAVNGSYNITYRLTVGNYGVAPLNQVSIKDDLRNTFLGHTIRVTSIKSLGALQVNTAFNGSTDIETLAANNSLAVGQKEQIEFTVNVTLNNGGSKFLNIANAAGTSVTGLKTTDVSTNGLIPDPNNDGNVSPSEPTPVDLQRPKEFIPGGFSPNGDGTNDKFVIENTGFKRLSLEVFNRWGNRVYRSNDYKNDWDGRCTEGISIGQDLPEGTYFYIVILDGKEKYVGHITLKR